MSDIISVTNSRVQAARNSLPIIAEVTASGQPKPHRDRFGQGEARTKVYEYLCRNPHQTNSDISKGTGINSSTICYAVKKLLESENIIIVSHNPERYSANLSDTIKTEMKAIKTTINPFIKI